jgi:hypothetical protein
MPFFQLKEATTPGTSTFFLLLSNILSIILALLFQSNFFSVVLVYLIQVEIIIFFQYLKQIFYGHKKERTISTAYYLVSVLLFTGFCILLTIVFLGMGGSYFLLNNTSPSATMPVLFNEFLFILITTALFFITHLLSFILHKPKNDELSLEATIVETINRLRPVVIIATIWTSILLILFPILLLFFVSPFPKHILSLIFLLLFMLTKTYFDISAHFNKNNSFTQKNLILSTIIPKEKVVEIKGKLYFGGLLNSGKEGRITLYKNTLRIKKEYEGIYPSQSSFESHLPLDQLKLTRINPHQFLIHSPYLQNDIALMVDTTTEDKSKDISSFDKLKELCKGNSISIEFIEK